MEFQFWVRILISLTAIVFLGLLFHLYKALLGEPERLRTAMKKQGIAGPTQKLLFGNALEMKKAREEADKVTGGAEGFPVSHNYGSALFPFFVEWMKQYGEVFMFALGNIQILLVSQADMVKEIAKCTSLNLGKPTYQAKQRGSLMGHGILTSNGPYWAHQRKVIAPEFYMEKVKGMIKMVQESTITLVNSWKDIIETNGGVAEIKIDHHIRSFSGDVISRACFGSSYSKGEEIFLKLRDLQQVSTKAMFTGGIPGMRYLPTSSNREAWTLEKEIKSMILKVVKDRTEAGYEKDLLQMIIEGSKSSDLGQDAIDRFIVDNCKNIYLAGYETTAVSAVWCLMLLAANPHWQERIRTEVLEICNGKMLDYDMIRKMKQLSMAINESLRLYPPVSVVSREAFTDMKFGATEVPKGVNIWTLVIVMHTDPKNWGPDSYEYNPERFLNGISGACKEPQLYMPFGIGPRVCLGQNLALMELKILIALILSNFSFSLSRNYKHVPTVKLVTEPGQGINLILKKL